MDNAKSEWVLSVTVSSANFNDLYQYDPTNKSWISIAAVGTPPSPRFHMGFVAMPDGRLCVFGGASNGGD